MIPDHPEIISPLRWKLAQAEFYINRFRALPRAERLFHGVPSGTYAERKLFGYDFVGDVSRDSPQRLIYLTGERFIGEARLVKKLLRPGMNVIDVGANIGYYVLLFAQCVGEGGHITAVEPSPDNLKDLQLNVHHNKLANVKVVAKAVGADTRVIGLRKGINSGVTDLDSAFTVEQEPIDDIAADRVDFLKIDVEGYEWAALLGAKRVLSQHRPILFLEVHPALVRQYNASVIQILEFLGQYYNDIRIYEPVRPLSLFAKTMAYYCNRVVHRVRAIGHVLDRCSSDDPPGSFWLVCRS